MFSRAKNNNSGDGGSHSEQREKRLAQLPLALRTDLDNISSGTTHKEHFTCKMPNMRCNPEFIDQVIQYFIDAPASVFSTVPKSVTYEMVDACWPEKFFREAPVVGVEEFGDDDAVHVFKRQFDNISESGAGGGEGGGAAGSGHDFFVTLKRTFLPNQLRVFKLQFNRSWQEKPPLQKLQMPANGLPKSGSGVKSALVTASRVGGGCGTLSKRDRVVKFQLPEAGK